MFTFTFVLWLLCVYFYCILWGRSRHFLDCSLVLMKTWNYHLWTLQIKLTSNYSYFNPSSHITLQHPQPPAPPPFAPVRVIIRKCADTRWQLLLLLPVRGPMRVQAAVAAMRRWSSCQSPWRSVVGEAYIPRWRPVVGQVHACLLLAPPTGPRQGLMGNTICWTSSSLFVF